MFQAPFSAPSVEGTGEEAHPLPCSFGCLCSGELSSICVGYVGCNESHGAVLRPTPWPMVGNGWLSNREPFTAVRDHVVVVPAHCLFQEGVDVRFGHSCLASGSSAKAEQVVGVAIASAELDADLGELDIGCVHGAVPLVVSVFNRGRTGFGWHRRFPRGIHLERARSRIPDIPSCFRDRCTTR